MIKIKRFLIKMINKPKKHTNKQMNTIQDQERKFGNIKEKVYKLDEKLSIGTKKLPIKSKRYESFKNNI